MKKFLLGLGLSSMVFVLAACGTSKTDATLNKLSNQLDKTANTISSIQRANPAEISISSETLEKMSNNEIKDNIDFSKDMLSCEELYKSEILAQTSKIKSNLSKNKKYTRAQTSAISDLSANLAKYTNTISYSKNEYESSLKSISSLKKNADRNQEKLNARLTQLSNNSNARLAYYQNIINTLNSLENVVCDCETCTPTTPSEEPTQTSDEQTKKHVSLTKNIDTYGPFMRNVGGGFMGGYPGFGYGYNRFAPGYGNFAGYPNGFYGGYGAGVNGYGINGYGFNSNNINMAGYPGYDILIVSGEKIIRNDENKQTPKSTQNTMETSKQNEKIEKNEQKTENFIEKPTDFIEKQEYIENKALRFDEEKEKVLRLREKTNSQELSPIQQEKSDEIKVVAHTFDINQKIKDLVK